MKNLKNGIGKGLCVFLMASFSCASFAITTRMDNDFFAFKPNSIFAIKSADEWHIPRFKLTLGLSGNLFSLDARGVNDEIPKACKQRFVSDIVSSPPTRSSIPRRSHKTDREGQLLTMRSNSFESNLCDIRIWLEGPSSYEGDFFRPAKRPQTPSVIVGIIEFKTESKVVYIEFAIGADDVESPVEEESSFLAPTITETIVIEDFECGDSCVLTVKRGKRLDEYYLCSPENMRRGSKVPVCLEIFGADDNHPNVKGRTATLILKKGNGGDRNYWIIGGRLHPSAGTSQTNTTGASNQGKKSGKDDFSWDTWLEATGNKTKVAPQVAASAIKITGSAPTSIDTVLKVCQHLVNITGPGKPGIGAIFAIDYLSPVDAATVYGNMGPQGKLTPLKLYANYRDGEKMYANGYLQKDTFGEFKCISAR